MIDVHPARFATSDCVVIHKSPLNSPCLHTAESLSSEHLAKTSTIADTKKSIYVIALPSGMETSLTVIVYACHEEHATKRLKFAFVRPLFNCHLPVFQQLPLHQGKPARRSLGEEGAGMGLKQFSR